MRLISQFRRAHLVILENPGRGFLSIPEVQNDTGTDITTRDIHLILPDNLGVEKASSRWELRMLTMEEKHKRYKILSQDGNSFFYI